MARRRPIHQDHPRRSALDGVEAPELYVAGSPRSDSRRQTSGTDVAHSPSEDRGGLSHHHGLSVEVNAVFPQRGQLTEAQPHHAAMSIRLRRRSPAAAVMASNCSSVIIGRSTDSSRPALRMEHRRSDRATSPARRCSANSADWTRLGFIAQRSDRGLRPGGLALRALPHSGARGPTVRYLRVGSAMMC